MYITIYDVKLNLDLTSNIPLDFYRYSYIYINPNKRGMPAATKWGACWRFFSNWNGAVGENSPMPRLIVGAGEGGGGRWEPFFD